jgi:hypothetical protein
MSPSISISLDLYLYNSPALILFCIRSSILRIKQTHPHHSSQNIAYDLDGPLLALIKLELHSSYALPAPKPKPTKAGHARRLKMRTEKTTPKDRPRDERMRRDERQRSHYHARSAQTLETAHWPDQSGYARRASCKALPSRSAASRRRACWDA